jgi:hypothetical protein
VEVEAARAMPVPTRVDTPRSPKRVALTVPPVEPERVLDSVEVPPGPWLSGALLATLALVAGMGAIVLGMWAVVSSIDSDAGTEVVRPPIYGAAQAISLLSKPSTVRLPLAGSDGRVILAVESNGRGMLVLDGLGVAPVGRSYQAWVLTSKPGPMAPLSAAVFTGVETIVPLSARIEPGSVVGVSIERAGGAPAPTKTLRLIAQRPQLVRQR